MDCADKTDKDIQFAVPPAPLWCQTKHRRASISSGQPESDSQLYVLQFWQNRVTRRYKGIFGKTHTRTHNCIQRQPCLGQWGARALIMTGTHERVAPHEKTNFSSGTVVSRTTYEPLSGHIVPRWIPSDSPSLNSTVSINQSEPSASNPLGKLHPLEELKKFGVKPCLDRSGKILFCGCYWRAMIRLMILSNK